MLDPKLLRTDLDAVKEALARRGFELDITTIQTVEASRKALQTKTQQLQNERNTRSKSIGKAKARGVDIQPLLAEVSQLGEQLKQAESELAELQNRMNTISLGIPNLLDDTVPVGADESANVVVLRSGEPREFDFDIKDHVECRKRVLFSETARVHRL